MNVISHMHRSHMHKTDRHYKPHVNRNVVLLSKIVGLIFILLLLAFILW